MHFDWTIVLFVLFITLFVDLYDCDSGEDAVVYSHTDYNCTDGEIRQSACLNGGVCFVLKLHDGIREPACHCPIDYTGKRCQELNYDFFFASTQIVIIVVVVVFVLVLGTIVTYVFYRRKKKLPLIPCRKQEPASIRGYEEDDIEADKMLNGNDRNNVEMADSSH